MNPLSHPPTKFFLQLLLLLMALAIELVAARIIMQREFQSHITQPGFIPPTPSPIAAATPRPSPTRSPSPLPPKPPPPPTFEYTGEDVWEALADYRSTHRKYQLARDERLCRLAQMRTDQLIAIGTLDGHAGFKSYFENKENFKVVGFARVAENLAFGFPTAVQVVEWGWDTSTEGHREAQLTEEFTHACVVADQGYAVLELGTNPF